MKNKNDLIMILCVVAIVILAAIPVVMLTYSHHQEVLKEQRIEASIEEAKVAKEKNQEIEKEKTQLDIYKKRLKELIQKMENGEDLTTSEEKELDQIKGYTEYIKEKYDY